MTVKVGIQIILHLYQLSLDSSHPLWSMNISCMAQHNSVPRNGTMNGEIRRWPQHGYKATENSNRQALTQVLVHGHFANNTRRVESIQFRHSYENS